MKALRDQVLRVVLALVDESVRTKDPRFEKVANDLVDSWVRTFRDFNDPDPRIHKAGQALSDHEKLLVRMEGGTDGQTEKD